jgi:hypothetical protein
MSLLREKSPYQSHDACIVAHAFITYALRGELEEYRQLQLVRLRRDTSSCDLVQGVSIDFDVTRNTSLLAAAREARRKEGRVAPGMER